MNVLRRLFFPMLVLAAAAAFADEELAPRGYGFEPLLDNGRAFQTASSSLPLRCLDAPGLLAQGAREQDETLARAVDAGFNAVTFEAPLYGPLGLSKRLGVFDAAQGEAFGRLLQSMERHRLYAFPVLWPASAVDAMVGTGTARAVFFSSKNAVGWQSWAARSLSQLAVGGRPLTASAAVGGWILYRGPWPGGEPGKNAAPEGVTPSTEAWLRGWAQGQVKLMRKLGFVQRLGLGLWPKRDLASGAVDAVAAPPPGPEAGEAAPVAPVLEGDDESAAQPEAVVEAPDSLPPVPGAPASGTGEAGDESPVPAALTPWDLEGLDWERMEAYFAGLPLSTQLDFIELSLDSQDWYRVGERLAEAAVKSEVPIYWRQDWRLASRYERGKHLEAPAPLAGLAGPWPDDDWPGEGESIWPPRGRGNLPVPFGFRKMQVLRQGSGWVLEVELNKPAQLGVQWGKAWPLDRRFESKGRPKAVYSVPLGGLASGQWFLLRAQGQRSGQGGVALWRTRWLKAP